MYCALENRDGQEISCLFAFQDMAYYKEPPFLIWLSFDLQVIPLFTYDKRQHTLQIPILWLIND